MIDRKREKFPALTDGVYLLSHSLGPMPTGAVESMNAYLDAWRGHTSEDAWMSAWWMRSQEIGDRYAALVGAAPGSTIPTASATAAMATVASCLDYSRRQTIVTTELDFPSMGYFWSAQQRRGARVRIVPSEDGLTTPMDRLLEAIDETTALVAVSHVCYRSSFRLEMKPIADRAHAAGALALFDVYQSAGVVEIDMEASGADILIGGSIKWLCGGPACGFLTVRPELIPSLEPTIAGWIGHAEPFAFAPGPMRYDATIRRFLSGTPSIPALYSVMPGLVLIAGIGVAPIAAESRNRTQRIVEHALAHGWRVNSPHDDRQRGGTVMIGADDPESLARRLRTRRVFVDWRPGAGIRLSPHVFNTDDEIDTALAEIGRALA